MKYKVFTTPSCPNCPIVKEEMQNYEIEGEKIDASQPKGLNQARELGISSVPFVVFFDDEGKEIKRCNTVDQIRDFLK